MWKFHYYKSMRIWSLHPRYLDSKGLVALWRETLLAQHVLQGQTKGYRFHPQLLRFKNCKHPVGAIADYLRGIWLEAQHRGYSFDASKIATASYGEKISVQSGQIDYERQHLQRKLDQRDPQKGVDFSLLKRLYLHPLFRRKPGGIETWEVV